MPEESWKVDLLTFFENGAHHNGTIGHSEQESRIFQEQLEHVRAFCEASNYQLLSVSSNLDDFLSDYFWQDSYESTHAYRNVGFVLLLQKQIRAYYYAGAWDISRFSVSLWEDSEHYEKWLLPNLSTDCTQIFSVSTAMNRMEKTRYISQFPETYDHLLVCYTSGSNCGKCDKCVRQLLALDYLGLLETYKNSIPYETYQKEKPWYELQLLSFRREDPFLNEIYQYALSHGFHFSIDRRLKAFLSRNLSRARGLKNIMRHKLSRVFHR
jgi:bacterioferritin-associated ferredoxin